MLLKDFHQFVVVALQFLWHRASLAVGANNGRGLDRNDAGCWCLCFSLLRLTPLQQSAPTILTDRNRNLNFTPFPACE
jgi:hypothetical protein